MQSNDTPAEPCVTADTPSAWRQIFGLDLRSLALLRVVLALITLVDVIQRWCEQHDFYSEAGVMPRAAFKAGVVPVEWQWTFHLTGSTALQNILFVVAIVAALALLVGYRTRLATIVSFVLLTSIQNRNVLNLSGADDVHRVLFLWGMFLPLGHCYSIDAAMALICPNRSSEARRDTLVVSPATVGLLLQVCFIYWFNAIAKYGPAWRSSFTAVYVALNASGFASALGLWLTRFPDPLKVLTVFTFSLEALGPCLLFIPWRQPFFRVMTILMFCALHIGLGLALTLGIFPFVSIACWLVLLPAEFWDWMALRWVTAARSDVRIYYDNQCAVCLKLAGLLKAFLGLPAGTLLPAQSSVSALADMERENSWVIDDGRGRRYYRSAALLYLLGLMPVVGRVARWLQRPAVIRVGDAIYRWIAGHRPLLGRLMGWLRPRPLHTTLPLAAHLLVVFLIGVTFFHNAREAKIRGRALWRDDDVSHVLLNRLTEVTGTLQHWQMFAPDPHSQSGWIVLDARLQDGSRIDLYTGKIESAEIPAVVSGTFADNRWRSYLYNLTHQRNAGCRRYYVDFMVREWNKRHGPAQQVREVAMNYVLQDARADGSLGPPERKLLGRYTYD